MSNSSSDSDEDNQVRNVSNILLKSHLDIDLGVDFGQAHKKRHGDLIFDASFEGANLGRVDQADQHEYELFIRPDVANPRYRMWFNFTVHNTKMNQCVIFNIVNLSEELGFFYEGFTPVVRSQSRPNWVRMKDSQVFYYRCPRHKLRHVLSLTFRFDNPEDIYQFALNYPYTNSRLDSYIDRWKDNSSSLDNHCTSSSLPPSPDWTNDAYYSDDDWHLSLAASYGRPSSQPNSSNRLLELPNSPTSGSYNHFISSRRLSQATISSSKLAEIHHRIEDNNELSIGDTNLSMGDKRELRRSKKKPPSRMQQQRSSLWFKSKFLNRSHLNRPITKLTITSVNEQRSSNTQHLDDSPDHSMSLSETDATKKQQDEQIAASKIRKKTIIILCRIHPSESPASFVCHGLIDFLLNISDGDTLASLARQFFIFEIFPMVDPDSVATGNSRTSILGHDLEQCWSEANDVAHPSLCAIKQELISLLTSIPSEDTNISININRNNAIKEKRCVDMLIDIHASFHNYGASLSGKLYHDIVRMERHALFPKLLSSISQDFYIEDCIFHDGHDEPSGLQEFIHQQDSNVDCYTLQVSHFGYYNKTSLGQEICHYNQHSYMRLGKCLVYAVLDLHRHTGHIPLSSIPIKLQQLLDSYHADETNAFKLSLIRNSN